MIFRYVSISSTFPGQLADCCAIFLGNLGIDMTTTALRF